MVKLIVEGVLEKEIVVNKLNRFSSLGNLDRALQRLKGERLSLRTNDCLKDQAQSWF